MKEKFVTLFIRALKEGDYDEIERLLEYMNNHKDHYAAIAREMDDDDFDRLEEAYQFGARKKGFFKCFKKLLDKFLM